MALGEALVVAGAGLMLIASFLPWYEVDLILATGRLNGWDEPGQAWSVGAVMASTLLAVVVSKRRLDPHSLPELRRPLSWERVVGVGGALPLVFVAMKWVGDSDFVAYGFYVAFVAGAVQLAGVVLVLRGRTPG